VAKHQVSLNEWNTSAGIRNVVGLPIENYSSVGNWLDLAMM
jgi:hypothetical protein